ncbi:hypothetical protein [Sphingomicrobium flavum]|uniref:hypothetical protein n=1 Tax=Sphingomicrobium flavum TaxID=1229164 RepID=UPI0021ADC48E|nr:hypothetical protein [Sphingomicrobium flavum]
MLFTLLAASALGASDFPTDHVHGDRVRADLRAIQQRVVDGKGPLAFITCRDELATNHCQGDIDALFASLPLDRLDRVHGPDSDKTLYYSTFIRSEEGQSTVWQIRYIPQERSNDLVMLRHYAPIPGPPLPPPPPETTQ